MKPTRNRVSVCTVESFHERAACSGIMDSRVPRDNSATAVRTVSIWQVRQDVYTSSRECWRNYAGQIGPAVEILCDAGIVDRDGNWLTQA